MKKILNLVLIVTLFFNGSFVFASEYFKNVDAYDTTFVTTAYYSPLPSQSYYVTGSYNSDKVLNGNGTNGADGTPVFFGMLAAPNKYPFGTKIWIEGLGIGTVNDRGGAIVKAGDPAGAKRTRYNHDRLDIWMGHGEPGLARALAWGKRIRRARVFLPGSTIPAEYTGEKIANSAFINHIPVIALKNQNTAPVDDSSIRLPNLSIGAKGDGVKKLQTYMKDMGFYNGEISGIYDKKLSLAVGNFQLKEGIIKTLYDSAAGYFGSKTLEKLDFKWKIIEQAKAEERFKKSMENWNLKDLLSIGLTLGDEGIAVIKVKEVLHSLGYVSFDEDEMNNERYDLLTTEAVYSFQKNIGLVDSKTHYRSGMMDEETSKELINAYNNDLKVDYSDKIYLGASISGKY